MKISNTSEWIMIGFAIFALGAVFRAYVLIRAEGLSGFTTRSSIVIGSYRNLVREGRAPLWPLIANYVCVALGMSIMFGSILFGKN